MASSAILHPFAVVSTYFFLFLDPFCLICQLNRDFKNLYFKWFHMTSDLDIEAASSDRLYIRNRKCKAAIS